MNVMPGRLLIFTGSMEKCKDDLTELFIFLLQDAKKYGDAERYKKLLASAKRRKMADIVRINEAIQ